MPNNDTSSTPSATKLGIFISMFPELHETFILRELVALERRGIDFTIYSLQYPRDEITLDDAIRLTRERTEYGSLLAPKALAAFAATLVRHPVKVIGAMAKVIWNGRDRPVEVIKSLAILPLSLQFGRHARANGVTHLHGHWANVPTTACWYLQQIMGFSWSAAIHGEDIFSANRFLPYKLDKAEFSVVCSGYFCNHLQHKIGLQKPTDVHLNYHGLDPKVMALSAQTTFNPRASNDPFRIISIGRLVPTKGHDTVLNAVAQVVRESTVDIHLDLVGYGPDEATLRQLVASLGLEEHVHFTGGLAFEEVLAHLVKANAFALAPRMIPGQPPDGIPNVIAEAMILRLPVVTTRVSAIPELVEDGVSGHLVPVDNVEDFATALRKLIDDPAHAKTISDAGFAKVSDLFDQQKNIDELLELFERYGALPRRVA
ncbi:MAG: glycosyltransferase family 4 protein [Pseudomonadota bacterium]